MGQQSVLAYYNVPEGIEVIFHRSAIVLAALAHALAWIVFLFLVFWPLYQGSVTTAVPAVAPDGIGIPPVAAAPGVSSQEVRFSESILEVNGPVVLIPLAVPVLLTAAGLLVALIARGRWTRLALVLAAAVLLLGFCVLTGFSIGLFYLPAALALLASAIIFSTTRRRDARATATVHD
jgi:hypothetical protein